MNTEPNLFKFATSELSQDAFICWLLSWVNVDSNEELRLCAKDLIMEFYHLKESNPKIIREDIGKIEIERQYKKIDIFIQVEIKSIKIPFIIEDKKNSLPHSGQLEKYTKIVEENMKINREHIQLIYFKTGYPFEHDINVKEHGYQLFDFEKLNQFFERYDISNEIFRDFKRYIEGKYHDYSRILKEDDNFDNFKHDFYQHHFMKQLAKRCAKRNYYELFTAYNRGGNPFTKYWFISKEKAIANSVTESLFYRIDKKNKKKGDVAYYLSIRQYSYINDKGHDIRISAEDKLSRLHQYRSIFESIIAQDSTLIFSKPQTDNTGKNESEVALLFFDGELNSPQKVLEYMPSIHQKFFEQIEHQGLLSDEEKTEIAKV